MSRTNPTDIEKVILLAACDTCGAPRLEWCTTGQYHHPSPHASPSPAQMLHSRRGNVLLEVYWLGVETGERDQRTADLKRVQREVDAAAARITAGGALRLRDVDRELAAIRRVLG